MRESRTNSKRSELTILSGPQEAYLLEPGGVTEDVSLTSSALLYSDHVHLYSMTAGELQWYANATRLPPVELAEFILWAERNNREMTLDETGVAKRDWLRDFVNASKNGNRKQRREAERHHKFIREDAHRLLKQQEKMWKDHGGDQLEQAVSAGALTIHSDWATDVITRPDEVDVDKMLGVVHGQLVATGGAIMFDSLMGNLVSAAERERFLPIANAQQVGIRRTKTGTAMISFLPAFPKASIENVLDARKIIRAPLEEYRLAVVELEAMLHPRGGSDVDDEALDDLWHDYVEPRVSTVIEALDDTSLSGAWRATKSGLLRGSIPGVTFVATQTGDYIPGVQPEDVQRVVNLAVEAGLPDLSNPLAAAVTTSVAAITGAYTVWKNGSQARREILRNNELAYLADTQRALAQRTR